MPSPLPTLPTALPDVELTKTARGSGQDAVVCFAADGDDPPRFGPGGAAVPDSWRADVALTGKAGEVHRGPVGWVVGIGEATPAHWRTAGAALVRAVNSRLAADSDAGRPIERTLRLRLPDGVTEAGMAELVRGLRLGGYQYAVVSAAPKPRVSGFCSTTESRTSTTSSRSTRTASAGRWRTSPTRATPSSTFQGSSN